MTGPVYTCLGLYIQYNILLSNLSKSKETFMEIESKLKQLNL